MYLQVKNTKKEKFNQFQTTKATLVKDIKSRGWEIKDCKVTELADALVDKTYKGADGKNVGGATRQYITRAKSAKTLNKTNNKPQVTTGLKVA